MFSQNKLRNIMQYARSTIEKRDQAKIASPTLLQNPNNTFPSEVRVPLKVMFFAADAGGGHKASASALIHQFKKHFPGSQCESFQLEECMNVWPYKNLVKSYGTLTARPNLWRVIYHVSNSRVFEPVMNYHSRITCEEICVKLIESYNPDVIISVHPNTNIVPCAAARKAGQSLNKHIPFFTVVTDLGSGHCGWFQKDVDRLYLASEKIFKLAKQRGQTPIERITLTGLPIRQDFDTVSRRLLGDSNISHKDQISEGKERKKSQTFFNVKEKGFIKEDLGLDSQTPMLLVMGGGEGTGLIYEIICELYVALELAEISCTVCVVCAKNAKLKIIFEETNWEKMLLERSESSYDRYKKILLRSVLPLKYARKYRVEEKSTQPESLVDDRNVHEESRDRAKMVNVVPLGYVSRMAEYMAAAEILITKAGPGTIAEAASLGVPVILTSFLPGQEAGNVDVVLEQEFGVFFSKPTDISSKVIQWIQDPDLLCRMSQNASKAGHPNAASDIVLDIGWRTHTWLRLNAERIEEKRRIINLNRSINIVSESDDSSVESVTQARNSN